MIRLREVVKIEVNVLLNISNNAGFPWAECSITENRLMYVSDSVGLKRSKRNTGIHRYEFELVTNDMAMTEGRGIKAKLSRAVDDTLFYVHPRLSYSQGTVPTSGIKVVGSQSANRDIISLASTGTVPWQLLAGDYIQMPNDTKVYEVAEDTLLQSGTQNVKLTSRIRLALTNATTIIANNVGWYLQSDGVIEVSMEASDNQDMQLVLKAVEQL
jgi:hypothetical protein